MLAALTSLAAALGVVVVTAGCGDGAGRRQSSVLPLGDGRPDEPPVVMNGELPFRYPAALYARRVQGNVTLRLFVDREGRTRPESTRVEESSGFDSMDSAAVRGSQELRFIPAKKHGEPVDIAVLFPVYFRHPEAAPLPGDTVLAKRAGSAQRSAGSGAPKP